MEARIIRNLIFILILSLFFIPQIDAKTKPDTFIEYTSNLIFSDCEGKDIILNINDHTLNTGKLYTKDDIKKLINEMSQYDFKEHNVDGKWFIEKGNEGLGILKCGENTLDILGRTYYWNDIEIIPPSNISVTEVHQSLTEKSFLRIGNVSFNIFGGVSLISISFISIVIISIGTFILILIKRKRISFKNYLISIRKK